MRRRTALGVLTGLVATVGTAAMGVPGASALDTSAESSTAEVRDHLKVSIANVGNVAQPPVGSILDAREPHILVVSEARSARAHLADVAERKGYVLRQYGTEEGEEGPNIALLVRKDVEIINRTAMKMNENWYFRPNCDVALNTRAPRVYPAVVLKVGGQRWNVVGVHFPPGGPDGGVLCATGARNGPAWKESKERIQAYANNHPEARVVAAGDFNAFDFEMVNHFPGFDVKDGGNVDHAISKKDRGVRFDWKERRDAPDSGHGWFSFGLSTPAG